jgi:hypothetical protein
MDPYAGPKPAAESLLPGALHDLRSLEVPAAGMLTMQERRHEPDLVGDPDLVSDGPGCLHDT